MSISDAYNPGFGPIQAVIHLKKSCLSDTTSLLSCCQQDFSLYSSPGLMSIILKASRRKSDNPVLYGAIADRFIPLFFNHRIQYLERWKKPTLKRQNPGGPFPVQRNLSRIIEIFTGRGGATTHRTAVAAYLNSNHTASLGMKFKNASESPFFNRVTFNSFLSMVISKDLPDFHHRGDTWSELLRGPQYALTRRTAAVSSLNSLPTKHSILFCGSQGSKINLCYRQIDQASMVNCRG